MKVEQVGESGVLRPEVRKFLDKLPVEEEELSPAEARKAIRKSIREEWSDTHRPFRGEVTDTAIPGAEKSIHLRIYKPKNAAGEHLIVFFHGGGWVVCDLDTHDQMAKLLAEHTRAVVVSVDYRLAPEHKYPAGLDDCYDAFLWCRKNAPSMGARPSRVIVAGDSAGGNLAASVAIRSMREEGPTVALQLLFFPVTDVSSFDTPSYRQYRQGYMLTPQEMVWYRDHYLTDATEATDPLVSPLLYRDFNNFPPAYVVTAEFDILRDEGEQYARALARQGVPVECTRYNGVIHGFLTMDRLIVGVEDMYREIGENAIRFLTDS
jgi:acetyl esterase